jgi:hypothetical protein
MKLCVDSEIDINLWNKFTINCLNSNPFQTIEFYNFYRELIGSNANAFAIIDKEEIQALTVVTVQQEKGVKSFFSKRGIVYGGIVFNEKKYIPDLLKAVEKFYASKLIYLEIRNFFDYTEFTSSFKNWKYEEHCNVQLKVDKYLDLDEYLKGLKYNRRREINQSLKNDALYSIAEKESELIEIYSILKDLYLERVKLPLPQVDFFLNMLDHPNFIIIKVVHNNKIIGGAFNIYLDTQRIYTMYYCGIRDYHKKIFPTHLAVVGVIDFAIKSKLKYVDFMGAGKPNETYGVRDYKLQFGGELVEHGRFMKVLNPAMFEIGKTGLKLLAKIKK